ncbi:zinc finger protein 26-like [Lutzomyia longipalpis]|uniref:zinc finger protein 26-like n=1 Tax=Lutzomyia longipalpis TaxID=7200 RepID=UPI00248371F2|nr:zinc finger protein 26-like [Lutzomyia longipalpis]
MDGVSEQEEKVLDTSILKEEYTIQTPRVPEVIYSGAIQSSLPGKSLLNQIKHKCSVCGVQFLNISQLSIHQKTHSSLGALGDFNCSECLRTFRFQQSLDEHKLRVHSNKAPLPYKASVASAGASRSVQQKSEQPTVVSKATTMKQQAARKTSGGVAEVATKVFECDKCEKKFKSKSGIKWHIRLIHEGIKQIFKMDRNNIYKSFQCNLCNKKYIREENLLVHMDTHKGKAFDCPKCFKKFPNKCLLQQHLHVHTDDLSCSRCMNTFPSIMYLFRHAVNQQKFIPPCERCEPNEENLTCCGREFGDLEKLQRHVKLRERIKCSLCCEVIYKNQRNKHIRDIHQIAIAPKTGFLPQISVQCKQCEKTFFKKNRYDTHSCFRNPYKRLLKYEPLERVEEEKSEESKEMKEDVEGAEIIAIPDEEILTKPVPMERPFECEICGLKFATKRSVSQHITFTHIRLHPYRVLAKDDDGLFQCTVCKEKVPFASLRKHLQEEGMDLWPCKVCGSLFRLLRDLKQHKRLHKTLKTSQSIEMLKCPHCPKTFPDKELFRLHKHRYKYEECKICGRKVVCLKNHMKRHSLKHLECEKCGKVLKGREALKRHIGIIHFGMQNTDFFYGKYVCSICNKIFDTMQVYDMHLASHKAPKSLACQQCNRVFKNKMALHIHQKKVHIKEKDKMYKKKKISLEEWKELYNLAEKLKADESGVTDQSKSDKVEDSKTEIIDLTTDTVKIEISDEE